MLKSDTSLPARLAPKTRSGLAWIKVAGHGVPYFLTDDGEPWTPIGQNDAICWDEFAGLFRRRDLASVEAHLIWLRDHGVTCLRLMLEYAQVRHRYIERPVGRFVPGMIQLWDDLFALCERVGMRILLTPFDTFWTWLHWRHHPYNRQNGGPLDHPSRMLLDEGARAAIKARLSFAVERWGGSGALFAWDLWNEIHPAQAEDSADEFGPFIADLSRHVRLLEMRLYGRSHPQTVSLFGPELSWRAHLPLREPIFRHPDLDFVNLHIYEQGTIDYPEDTVAAAIGMGRIVREALADIKDDRPFFDSEHGPIHSYKDHHITLPEAFDDEYFRHMQWAHFASGGAGGGMRWPNRKPHRLTAGMRAAQKALADFLPLIDWTNFRRVNVNQELTADQVGLALFGCGDADQAIVWCLRRNTIGPDGRLNQDVPAIAPTIAVPGLSAGNFIVRAWNTERGCPIGNDAMMTHDQRDGLLVQLPAFARDCALAIRRFNL